MRDSKHSICQQSRIPATSDRLRFDRIVSQPLFRFHGGGLFPRIEILLVYAELEDLAHYVLSRLPTRDETIRLVCM